MLPIWKKIQNWEFVLFFRAWERASLQEFRVHEPPLQSEMALQQIRNRRTAIQGWSARVPSVSDTCDICSMTKHTHIHTHIYLLIFCSSYHSVTVDRGTSELGPSILEDQHIPNIDSLFPLKGIVAFHLHCGHLKWTIGHDWVLHMAADAVKFGSCNHL